MKNKLPQVSEIKLTYKTRVKSADRPQIRNSQDAFDILWGYWNEDEIELLENFNILLLDRANRVLGFAHISKGGVSGTVVDAKIIFATALKARASAIILAHNHPSSNLRPSQADIELTTKLKAAGKVLDISVLDHLILTPDEKYYSFADEGTF